jgi:homoserine dehydrogenase
MIIPDAGALCTGIRLKPGKMSKIKIGIIGFGCVGRGLYDVLQKTGGIEAEIVKICVKDRSKPRSLPAHYFTFDRYEIIANPEIDVVVELIDDAEVAFEIVRESVRRGKAVVTANKKMVAERFAELYELQNVYKVPVLYEAACCASIPVIRNLEEYYDNDQLKAIEGIVNGTTNFILSKVSDGRLSYGLALKNAQDNGFAESDPFSDVSGLDAKYKACILTAHAFGLFVEPQRVFNYGIETLSGFDLRYASEKGYKIKLIASVKKIHDKIATWVIPQLVPRENILYQVDQEYNGVLVEAVFSDRQFFIGKGAGSHPTGSAVLSDISALTYNYRYEYKKRQQKQQYEPTNEFELKVYIRFPAGSTLQGLSFLSIEEEYKGRDVQYVVGTLLFSDLLKSPLLSDANVFIAQFPTLTADIHLN